MAEERAEQLAGEKPRQRGRWWRRLALGALLLPVLLYLLREPLVHPALARLVSSLATRPGGLQLSIDEIHGDWFRTLSVRGVRLSTPSGPLREVRVRWAELELDLRALASRRDLSAIVALRVEGARAAIDLTRPSPQADRDPAGGGAWPAAPNSFPALEGSDISLELIAGEGLALELEGLELTSSGSPSERVLAASAGSARVASGTREWCGPLALTLLASPGEVRVDELAAGESRLLENAFLDWSRMESRCLTWSAELLDGHARTDGRLDRSDLSGSLRLEGADVAAYGAFLPGDVASLSAQLDCTADYAVDLERAGDVRASLELEARQVSWRGEHIDRLSGTGRLDSGVLLVRDLRANQGDVNRIEIADLRIPLRAGSGPEVLKASQAAVVFEIHDLGQLPFSTVDELPEHLLEGGGRIRSGRVELDRGRLVFTGGAIDLERGFVDLEPSGAAQRSIELEAAVDIADLGQLGRLWGASDYAGTLSGRLTLGGTLGRPTGHLDWTGAGIRLGNVPLGDLELFAQAAGGVVRVESLRCVGPLGELNASGGYDLESERLAALAIEARVSDLGPLGLLPAEDLQLLEPVTVSARLDGPWRSPTGLLDLRAPAARIFDQELDELLLESSVTEGTVRVERLDLYGAWGHGMASGTGSLPLDGEPLGLTLETLVVERGSSRLELAEPFEARFAGPSFSVGPARLTGSAGTLSLDARRDSDGVRIEATTEALDLAEFLAELPVSLRGIDLRLSFEDGAGGARLATSGTIDQVLASESLDELTVAWEATASAGLTRVEELRVERDGHVVLAIEGELPLDPTSPTPLGDGELDLGATLDIAKDWAGRVPLPERLGTLAGAVAGQVQLAGTWDAVRGAVTLRARDVSLSGPDVASWFATPARLDVDLDLGETVAGRIHADLPGVASVDWQGALETPLDVRALLAPDSTGAGAWLDAPFEGEGAVEVLSLAAVTRRLQGIRRLDGNARVRARVGGSLAAPTLEGDATLTDCELKLTSEIPTLTQLNAQLSFDLESLHLDEVSAEMGAAPVKLSGSLDWSEAPLDIDVRISGEEILLVRSASNRLRADTQLHLAGPLSQMHLEGTLGLRASRINQQIDLIPRPSSLAASGAVRTASRGFQFFSFREPPLSDMTLDVKIDTIDPLLLSTNLASSTWSIDLRLKGTGRVPLPEGQIFMDETRVKLPAGVLVFDSGRVAFPRQNPFVPELEMRGETRLAGYDVSVTVEGPYDQPEVLLSSSPPLREGELFLLVITGEVPQESLADSSQRAAQSITLYLARDIFQRWTSSGSLDDTESLFDRLEVIQGRNVSRSGTQTTEVTFRVEEGIVRDRGTFYLVGERDVYEAINLGFRVVFRFQ